MGNLANSFLSAGRQLSFCFCFPGIPINIQLFIP
jgi:hypothetical protein